MKITDNNIQKFENELTAFKSKNHEQKQCKS